MPKLSDFHVPAPNPDGRKARSEKTVFNLLGGDEL